MVLVLFVFLIGKLLKENCVFKEVRKGFKNVGCVDDWLFIFRDFNIFGILIMWSED